MLADRGIVCIDEFDKMSDVDRVSIHEVMEQQTVTIAKAGIHMSLNARCSVVAAANPAYGQYDRSIAPSKNVNMPDSLLSRFDLLFIVLDQPDPEVDRDISDKVISNHRFISKHGANSIEDNDVVDEEEETPVYQRFDKLLHSHIAGGQKGRLDILTTSFLKKYIKFAKETYNPVLTEETSEFIGQAYKELRSREQHERALPVTARALETLIRLSTAHAKARLSKKVLLQDAETALEVMKFAIENDSAVVKDDDGHNTPAPASRGADATSRSTNEGGDADGDRNEGDAEFDDKDAGKENDPGAIPISSPSRYLLCFSR